MKFVPYVFDSNGIKVPVAISQMTFQDAKKTTEPPVWQTPWTSRFILNNTLEKYSFKVGNELIALGAYEIQENLLLVHIVYMEAGPDSNPTMDHGSPRFTGIGKLLIAQGIKLSIDNGFAGDVILEAKTTSLAQHYAKDFGAITLPSYGNCAPRMLIADEAAKRIFFSFLE